VRTTVDLRWKTEIIDSKSIDGSSYDPLSIPAELTASTNRCDGTVEQNGNGQNQLIFVGIVLTILQQVSHLFRIQFRDQRSYILFGLIVGKSIILKLLLKAENVLMKKEQVLRMMLLFLLLIHWNL
jgi:hypothetical protein